MTDIQGKAMLAGLFFGIWPLFMSRSGLAGNFSSTIFSLVVLLVILPLGIHDLQFAKLAEARWAFVVLAGVASACGVIFFNAGLLKSSPETVGTFFVLMITVQITVAALYQAILVGVSPSKLIGFALAGGAAYFLSK
jgi:hypothetical protein